ncbi:hypothetical protein PRK78_000797 [Emydomyces testavorans]|uniref:Uncharacterized protein n=1 Tax=Emydomyces testavorans TaxID=2070801 RepID=A0AAF0DBB3_9EURO|nr:hypothetical protein PRK78_000797 [Emydomyces testavorans]
MEEEVKTNYFQKIYVGHANRIITDYITRGTRHKISRAQIEMQILEQIEKSSLPTSYRIAWYALVLQTDTFDVYWLGQRDQHHLSRESIARLKPNMELINSCVFESPESSPANSDREMSNSPEVQLVPQVTHHSSSSSPIRDNSPNDHDSSSETSTSSPTPLARSGTQGQPEEDPIEGIATTASTESQPLHPNTGGKTIPELYATGAFRTPRKSTPKATPPTRKRRKSTGTLRPRKASRTKATTPKPKRPTAIKMPKSRPLTDIADVDENGDPILAATTPEQNAIDPDLEPIEQPSQTTITDPNPQRRAWETRRRKAAEAAVAKAAALAEKQGTTTTTTTPALPDAVEPPAATETSKAGEAGAGGGSRQKKTVRFTSPEIRLINEEEY